MKFTLAWLREHLATEAPLERLTETLSAIGLEVEGVTDRGAALAAFRTARVLEAVPHPNADRLRVCRVDLGGEVASVVCGAPNARTGLHAVFAPPGAVIPATGLVLKVGEIRGVASAGMLVSARELGLGEDHEGIIELPEGTPVGQSYAAWAGLDDPVIEIGVTPNRGDALAVRGVARDLAAAGLGELRPWSASAVPGGFASPIGWRIDWPEACPWILGRTLRGVRNGPSPDWLQRRLLAVGLRPISALVDITNLFALDLGRPLHVFDADRVAGGTLVLRRGAGEALAALNGREYGVTAEDLVIADAAGVQSLAGIIGGEATSCTETTTSVFLECALFDPVAIARAGRRHQIATDARARFERGVDQALPPAAIEAATRLILDLCGGEASEVVSAGAEPDWRRQASLTAAQLAALAGEAVPEGEIAAILDRLGFARVASESGRITVAVPPWRNDIASGELPSAAAGLEAARAETARAGAATVTPAVELIEEVLRVRGLDRIAPVSLPRAAAVPASPLTPAQSRTELARRTLASRGLSECVTFSFLAAAEAARFGDTPAGLRLSNPIAADLDQLRASPLATLVLAAARNAARGLADAGLFEIGPGFAPEGQRLVAAGVRTGQTPRHWQIAARPRDAMDAKADVLAVLAALGVPMEALSVTSEASPAWHPGRAGMVRQGPRTVLARFGALHPALLAACDLPQGACGFEIELDAIAEPKRRRRAPPELSAFQPVRRDFAFLLPSGGSAEAVLRAARGADRTLITAVGVFDLYDGAGLPEGCRSLGIEVTIQPRERTLTDVEIDGVAARLVDAVARATGASLR